MNEIDVLIKSYDMQRKRMEGLSPLICQWFDIVLMDIHRSLPKQEGGILLGCPIWGPKYVDEMVRYSLASLGEEQNLQALAHKASIVFYGLKSDRPNIWAATRWLRQSGIHTVWRDVPAEMFHALKETPEDKYAILSPVQNLLAIEAGHNGMGLHMYMPDHLYCAGYFKRLAELGGKHPAIVQQTCSVDVGSAASDVEYWRQVGSDFLAIPPAQLGGLMLKHMHRRTSRTIMNGLNQGDYPRSHQATWIGKDAIHMASAPQNIAWLCHELCMDAPVAFTSTMDMLPPDYIPFGMSYMAQPGDGLVHAELSSPMDLVKAGLDGYGTLEEFVYRHWAQVGFTEDYMEWFTRRCLIPIPEGAAWEWFEGRDGRPMRGGEIAAQHRHIVSAVLQGHVPAMKRMFRGQAPLRWPRPDDIDWLNGMEPEAVKEAADD